MVSVAIFAWVWMRNGCVMDAIWNNLDANAAKLNTETALA